MKNYKLKISLEGIKPQISREVLVPEQMFLNDLHHIIQIVMGWENCHLYEFTHSGNKYGMMIDDGWGDPVIDAKTVKIDSILSVKGDEVEYLYDFGDSWSHIIRLVEITKGDKLPVCLKGKRACPPEDIGGIYGYMEFLETISDPEDPQYEDMIEWVGGEFDPEKFDLNGVNNILKKVFKK